MQLNRVLTGRRHCNVGFTLVELLVVIAIIAMLVGLLLPAIGGSREAARRTQCKNNLKQLGLGVLSYHETHSKFPTGSPIVSRPNQPGLSWQVYILPFIEQQNLYSVIDPQPNGMAKFDQSREVALTAIPTFLCPSGDSFEGAEILKPSHYVGVSGAGRNGAYVDLEDNTCGDYFNDGLLYPKSETSSAHVKDGASNTIMVGERHYFPEDSWLSGAYWLQSPKRQVCMQSTKNVRWPINCSNETCGYAQRDPNRPDGAKRLLQNDTMFSSPHDGAQFLFADGHVELLTNDTDLECLKHLATINGSEVICSR